MKSKRVLALALAASLVVSCQTVGKAKEKVVDISYREKQDRFIEAGYDPSYLGRDINDYDAFMKMRGKPEGLIRKTVVNRHDSEKDEEITLQYKYYEMRYYGFSKRALWDPPKSRLMAVLSKDMGSYLYSIEPGMVKAKVLAILGIEATGKGTVEFSNEKGHWAILIFEDEKLSRIIWDYSRE